MGVGSVSGYLLDMRPRGAGGGSSGAPIDATYITQTPNATLTNEQALSLLATGLLKNTTGTGVLSIGVPTIDFASAAQGALADTSLQPGDIGVLVQGWDADLDTLAALAKVKGNLIAGTGATWQALPVGADGLTLVADSLEATGLKWAAIVAGVSSVFGRTGAVISANGDYTASQVTNVPAGNIAGVTIQAAIDELDTEKAGLALANVFTTGQTINPGSDVTELTLKAFATKTTPFILLRNSANTELLRLDANTEFDVFIGKEAGQNVSGDRNTLIGHKSGKLMTTPQRNTALGYNTLGSEGITTGGSNAAFGADVLSNLTSGQFNVGFGVSTLYALTTGSNNMAIGRHALRFLVSGSNNVAIGFQAGEQTTVANNVYIGYKAGINNVSGGNNTIIGYQAGLSMGNAQYCVFIGSDAGANETTDNKLYIHNTNTSTPLIYGDFNAPRLVTHSYFEVLQLSTTKAKPTIKLQQADLSEEFIRFQATVGAGNPIDTAALGAYYGKVRVYVEGVGAKWLALYD